MRRRTVAVLVILALAFLYGVPLVPASVPSPTGRGFVPYKESISCYLQGGWPRGFIGTNYFDGEQSGGCYPILF